MNLLFTILTLVAPLGTIDTVYHVPEVVVTGSPKYGTTITGQPLAATSLPSYRIERSRIEEPKDLSAIVPNFYQADYGSKMTSSIYIRGIGSRMDQPAMGLYVDNVPVLDKNNYDFDLFDIRRIDVLRGPQGTLYGRNTIGGIIDIRTLSPLEYQGTRIGADYSSANTIKFRLSTYHKPADNFGVSAAVNHNSSDGFYKNIYDGSHADKIRSNSGRLRLQWKPGENWLIDNTLSVGVVKQNGFPYAYFDQMTGQRGDINHNDPCKYERNSLSNGLTVRYDNGAVQLFSSTSYQHLYDVMTLDQDFLPKSMFTLRQSQNDNAATQEFVVKSSDDQGAKWKWMFGAFGFHRNIGMSAPVTFKRDGIDQLILLNANQGIHSEFPDYNLLIEEEEFVIGSRFRLPAYGASAYHQSVVELGKWKLTAGLRFDWEHTGIEYRNQADIHYRLDPTMPSYKHLPVRMEGEDSKSFYELLPRFAATYDFGSGTVYASVARGYKAGGFNTQIFSDLLQNRMMTDLMTDLGVYFDGVGPAYDGAKAVYYKPEYSWNYEIGGDAYLLDNKLKLDAALFYMDVQDQQLTVFPPGNGTGRLMSNAGHTRSLGAEVSAEYRKGDFFVMGSYGHTDARFLSYDDGRENYAGNRIPYAPVNTVYLATEYDLVFNNRTTDRLVFHLGWQGVGKIYWNESNTASQPFYGQLNASLTWKRAKYSVGVWARNITDTQYDTFYFRSVGNSFVQRGKPVRAGVSVSFNL